jgi:hypothetical protein
MVKLPRELQGKLKYIPGSPYAIPDLKRPLPEAHQCEGRRAENTTERRRRRPRPKRAPEMALVEERDYRRGYRGFARRCSRQSTWPSGSIAGSGCRRLIIWQFTPIKKGFSPFSCEAPRKKPRPATVTRDVYLQSQIVNLQESQTDALLNVPQTAGYRSDDQTAEMLNGPQAYANRNVPITPRKSNVPGTSANRDAADRQAQKRL